MDRNTYIPKNAIELKLLKKELRSELKLKEDIIILGISGIKNSIVGSARLALGVYFRQLAVQLLARIIRSKFKFR